MKPPMLLVQLWAVFRKEVRQTAQDKRIVAMLTIAPFLQLLVFGYAIDLQVDRVPTVVVDQDHSEDSRRLVAALLADGSLTQVGSASSVQEAEEWLDDGLAAVVLVMPTGLSRDLARGDPTQLQVLLDGTDPDAFLAMIVVSDGIPNKSEDATASVLASEAAWDDDVHIWTVSYEGGEGIDTDFMTSLTQGRGEAYITPVPEDLPGIMIEIATAIPVVIVD